MRVLITGGTGFVGAHTAAALIDAGHAVRLLVRDPARIPRALGPLGVPAVDHVIGNVTDASSVAVAMEGCDVMVHAAALVTFDRRRTGEVVRVNVEAAHRVLQMAAEHGLDPVVFVSSVSALHPPREPVLTRDSPVGLGRDLYTSSKAEAESAARALQRSGAPIVITYPGGVWGPHDPNLGEQTRAVLFLARVALYPDTRGGSLVVDVRDVAAAHAAAMEPGRGPRRYTLGGNFFSGPDLVGIFRAVTGRRAIAPPLPAWLLRGLGRVGDRVNPLLGSPLPFTSEGMDTLTRSVPTDDSSTFAELGITYRDPELTVGDTLRWLHREGLLRPAQVGRLAA